MVGFRISRDAGAHLRLHCIFARQAGRRGQGSSPIPAGARDHVFISEDRAELRSAGDLVRSPAAASAELGDRLLIGTVDECVGRLQRLEAAGISEVFVWPLRDEVAQLELFIEEVVGRLG